MAKATAKAGRVSMSDLRAMINKKAKVAMWRTTFVKITQQK